MSKKPGLTLGMMVYEEASTLDGVLRSARPAVDEIIIGVDKACTDATPEIAMRWADQLFEYDFQQDFSSIRNQVFERASHQWFLQLDGHEFLAEDSYGPLSSLGQLSQDHPEVAAGLVVHIIWDHYWEGIEPVWQMLSPRLLRTDLDVRYERAIHNTPRWGPQYTAARVAEVRLDHRQERPRRELRDAQRRQFYEEGLRKQIQVQQDEDISLDWFQLGVERLAKEGINEAADSFKQALETATGNSERYLYALNLGMILVRVPGRMEEGEKYLREAESYDPERCEHLIELAEVYLAKGDLMVAERYCCRAGASFGAVPFRGMTCHIPSYTYRPWIRAAMCAAQAGFLPRALSHLSRTEIFPYRPKEEIERNRIQIQEGMTGGTRDGDFLRLLPVDSTRDPIEVPI